jgi:hypothetical protein
VTIGQFDPPWTLVPDSFISVYVRVNLAGVIGAGGYGWTSADQDSVCIMGGGNTDLDWGTPFYLTQEQAPTNSASAFSMPPTTFYSGRIRLLKRLVNEGDDIAYKFRLGSNWSYGTVQRSEQLSDPPYGGGNRHFKIPVGKKDTTLQYVHFGDVKPVGQTNKDTCYVTFRTNVAAAIAGGGFSIGDTIQVQSGWFNTALEVGRTRNLVRQGLTQFYQVIDTLVTKIGGILDYQYYIVKNGQGIRENYYDFNYSGPTPSEAERRQVNIPSNTFTVYDTAKSVSNARRQPEFPNQALLSQNVRVKWVVDLRPAYYQVKYGGTALIAIQGPDTVTVADSVFAWGVGINGPATGGPNGPLSVDWATWDRTLVNPDSGRKMWDDGSHGDLVAGDSLYTTEFRYTTANKKGLVYKFGIYGSDNEGGVGGFGNNHLANVSDADTVFTILTQFGSINPNFYNKWDYDNQVPKLVGVTDLPGLPLVYSLEQNYPNPFNPSTKIEFTIPTTSFVQIKVFNIIGQEVATLVNEQVKPGRYSATFDATRFASGVYLYRIDAGQFVTTKKMLLVK